jgi:hypothetical protein
MNRTVRLGKPAALRLHVAVLAAALVFPGDIWGQKPQGNPAVRSVVRAAPPVALANGRPSIQAFKGQSVILIYGNSPRTGAVRKQVKEVQRQFKELAGRQAVFVAAIESNPELLASDVPFLLAKDPAVVRSSFGWNGSFGLAIIGPDGNIDLLTEKVTPGPRLRDVIQNSYSVQSATRRSSSTRQ